MTREAGWYDDPQDPDTLRYWDGVQWSQHTSPKQKPDLDRAGAGPIQPGSQAAPQGGWQQAQPGSYGAQAPHQGQQQAGWGQPMPGGAYAKVASGPTTPDGQPIASWGMRFLARIIDYILLGILTYLVSFVVAPDFWSNYLDFVTQMTSTSGGMVNIPDDIQNDLAKIALSAAIVGFLYELLMLKFLSATVGKLATGLRVRLRDQPGPLSWGTAAIRALVWYGPSLLGGIRGIGNFTSLIVLLNGLWPLWDTKKQSLNDKAAKTNVVKKV